ncbi:MAG: DUF87 domain-containing protein [Methylacidiphilales bacterium]|nr:DUF87 domain-containing protein [Candidatus Methylacidiphilales bacterium]
MINTIQQILKRRGQDVKIPEDIKIKEESPPFKIGDDELSDKIAPPFVYIEDDKINIGGAYYRLFYVAEWPPVVSRDLWHRILQFSGNIYIALHHTVISPDIASQALAREATALRTQRNLLAIQKRDPNEADALRLNRITDARIKVVLHGEPIFMLTAVIGIAAPTVEMLEKYSTMIKQLLQYAGINSFYVAQFEQDKAFTSILPLGVNLMATHRRNIDADTAVSMFPMISEENVVKKGFFYGVDVANKAAIFVNPMALDNPNSIIIGIPGSGKSLFLKDLIEQAILRKMKVFVIDIEDEYRKLCDDLGGAYLDMASNSQYKINVMEPAYNDPEGLHGAMKDFLTWVESIQGIPLDAFQREAFHKAYFLAFNSKGIYHDKPETLRKAPPKLSDFYDALETVAKVHRTKNPAVEKAARHLQSILYAYTYGDTNKSYDCDSNIDVETYSLVVFGLKNLKRGDLRARMQQILSWTLVQVLNNTEIPKLEIVDEAWFLLDSDSTAAALAERARRFRKKNASLWLATQNVVDFAANRHASTIVSIADTRLYFKQTPISVEQIGQIGKLSAAEKAVLPTLEPGKFLLHAGNIRRLVYKPYPQSRHKLYTTRPSDHYPNSPV